MAPAIRAATSSGSAGPAGCCYRPFVASFTGSIVTDARVPRCTDTLQSKNALTCGFGPDGAIIEIIAA